MYLYEKIMTQKNKIDLVNVTCEAKEPKDELF